MAKIRILYKTIVCESNHCEWKESRKKNAKIGQCEHLVRNSNGISGSPLCEYFIKDLDVVDGRIARCTECIDAECS